MRMTDAQRRTFEFRECLGRGGFGEVYLAKMTVPSGLSSTVAVKVLHAGLDPRSQGVRRLIDEGKILSLLNHPAIVGVHDLAIIEGRVALVTEFIEGADLGDCLEGDDPIPPGALFEAFALVADALHAAHNAVNSDGVHLGLLHRDVKPQNVRIGRHGQVKLLDFGIATATGIEREAQTGTNALIGSFAYMPPERFRRQPMKPSGDFYSLGCSLFECLAEARLFHLDDIAGLLGPKTDPVASAEFYEERFKLLTRGTEATELIRSMVSLRADDRPDGPTIVAALEDLASNVGGLRLARWARAHPWKTLGSADNGTLTGQVVVESMGESMGEHASRLSHSAPLPTHPTFDFSEATASDFSEPELATDEQVSSKRRPVLLLLFPLLVVGTLAATAIGVGLGVLFLPDSTVAAHTDAPEPQPEKPQPNNTHDPATPDPIEPVVPVAPAPVTPQNPLPAPEPPQPVDPTAPTPKPATPSDPVAPDPQPELGTPLGVGLGIDRCGTLAALETKAATGALGSSSSQCLAGGMRDSALTQTQREKLGRVVLVDALTRCRKGDCRDYEREQPYFFTEVTRSDAEMMFVWAGHQLKQNRSSDARLWSKRALARKNQWTGSTHISRVDSLMGIRAKASYALWSADTRNDTLRNTARSHAAAWANYRGQVGRKTQEAMDLCISAAGSAELCNARVNDAVATAKVVFVSVPAGAQVLIDGKARGSTPVELQLSFGEHTVELSGTTSSNKTIEVGSSKQKRWTWISTDARWTGAF